MRCSLGGALTAVSQKCEAITCMYKSQSATDENRLTVPLRMCISPPLPSLHFRNTLHMYKCLCASARAALLSRESALQLLCEAVLESDDLSRKLEALKAAQIDPSKRSLFQKMGGGGDSAEQIAKYETKAAAALDLLAKRREVYSEVRRHFAYFSADCYSCASSKGIVSHANRHAVQLTWMPRGCTRCSCRISKR